MKKILRNGASAAAMLSAVSISAVAINGAIKEPIAPQNMELKQDQIVSNFTNWGLRNVKTLARGRGLYTIPHEGCMQFIPVTDDTSILKARGLDGQRVMIDAMCASRPGNVYFRGYDLEGHRAIIDPRSIGYDLKLLRHVGSDTNLTP